MALTGKNNGGNTISDVSSIQDKIKIATVTAKPADKKSQFAVYYEKVKDAVETLEEGYGYIEDFLEVAEDVISEEADVVGGVYESFLNTAEDPLSLSGDAGAGGDNISTSKSNANKECGTFSMVGDLVSGAKEVASVFKSSLKSLKGLTSGIGDCSWKDCFAIAYNGMMANISDISVNISEINGLCEKLYNTLNSVERPFKADATVAFYDSLIDGLNSVKSLVNDSYGTFKNNKYFDRSKWREAREELGDVADGIEQGMGKTTETYFAESLIPDLISTSNQIKYRLCILQNTYERMNLVAENINKLSTEKPMSSTEMNISSFLDRLRCHLDFLTKKLDELKTKNVMQAQTRLLDVYLHIQELAATMSGLEEFLVTIVKAGQDDRMEYELPQDDSTKILASGIEYSALVMDFLSEASSLIYSGRSTNRLSQLLTALKASSIDLGTNTNLYTAALYDPDSKYAEYLDRGREYLTTAAYLIESNFSEYKELFLKGGFSEAAMAVAEDFLLLAFDKYLGIVQNDSNEYALKGTYTAYRDSVKRAADERKADNMAKNLKSVLKDSTIGDIKEARKQNKERMSAQMSLYKRISGIINQVTTMKNTKGSWMNRVINRVGMAQEMAQTLVTNNSESMLSCNRFVNKG